MSIARVWSFVSRVVRGFPPHRVGDDFGQQDVDLCFIEPMQSGQFGAQKDGAIFGYLSKLRSLIAVAHF